MPQATPTAELLYETLRLRPRVDLDDLAQAWSTTRPDGLYALTDYERAAMWIMRKLEEAEAADAAPAAFVAPLRRHAQSAAARNEQVDEEASDVLEHLTHEGIPCILLKGIARRAAGARYPCGDARTTTDIDIIVPPDELMNACDSLVEAGWAWKGDRNLPTHTIALMGQGRVAVEVHRTLSAAVSPDDAWHRANDDARDVAWNGRMVAIPSPTELLWHALTNAMAQGTKAWRLRFFLDAASVLAGHEPITWEIIGGRLDAGEVAAQGAPRRWLDAAAQLAGVDIPPGILGGVAPYDVVHALRWRLNVLRQRRPHGLGGRLLEEGTRRELGYPLAPKAPNTGIYKRTRRRLGGLAARMIYNVWRATGARAMAI